MNIVIINGSPRSNGTTAAILHMLEEHLLQRGDVFVEFVDIGNLELTSCQGCCACYKTGHNISGQLKQFIDRGHFVIEQLLYDKYAISVVTGENYESSYKGVLDRWKNIGIIQKW